MQVMMDVLSQDCELWHFEVLASGVCDASLWSCSYLSSALSKGAELAYGLSLSTSGSQPSSGG